MSKETLKQLEQIARSLGAETVAEEARSLAERASEGRFFVACVGQFKRGKSTLLNALIGADILPTGTVPVTSVVTVVRYGKEISIRLRNADRVWREIDPSEIIQYVSEDQNPGNTKQIMAVEVFAPGELLASGLCFVDTPGLGSVFEANSEATEDFIPHIDAALFVFGADPPITGEEIHLAEDISKQVDTFIFVQNKVDRVMENESEEAAKFAQRILSEHLHRSVDRIYKISALECFKDGQGTRDWPFLKQSLKQLAEESGQILVQDAVQRGINRLGARLRNILNEEMDALQRPAAETERRLELLHDASNEAARALWELGPLFDAELARLGRTFKTRRAEFLKEVLPEAREILLRDILQQSATIKFGPVLRDYAFHHAQDVARQEVLPWLAKSEKEAKEAYQGAVGRFAELLDNLLARLRESDAWTTIPLPENVGQDSGLKSGRNFIFHEFQNVASPAGFIPLLQWVADVLLPRNLTLRYVERDVLSFLRLLLDVNTARVENSLKQRLQDSRLRMESEIRFTLMEVLNAAERGMVYARAKQAEGKEAVQAEVQRLQEQKEKIEGVLS
jgi:GTPase Era involved in 16S rRNA processing